MFGVKSLGGGGVHLMVRKGLSQSSSWVGRSSCTSMGRIRMPTLTFTVPVFVRFLPTPTGRRREAA